MALDFEKTRLFPIDVPRSEPTNLNRAAALGQSGRMEQEKSKMAWTFSSILSARDEVHDRVAGLQVLGRDGTWHDVEPADGALLVNLGDLTARLTNDRWMSTLHRVKPPVVNGAIKRRRSAAFFHDGNPDAVIETLASHRDASGEAYEPITVRDHIKAKLAGSRQGRKNLAAVREAERVLAAAKAGAQAAARQGVSAPRS